MNKQTQDRYAAFWGGFSLGRPLLFITAPAAADIEPHPDDIRPTDADDLNDWYFNPKRVLSRLARNVKNTYYAAEALPIVFPMATTLPAIQAGFLGGDYRVFPDNGSGWCDPIIDDLKKWPEIATVNSENVWWKRTLILSEAQCLAEEGCIVAHPDTQGGGQILDLLRGTERLAMDLIDQPETVKAAMQKIDETWLEYWNTLNAVIGKYQNCYADWLRVYSDKPMVCPECDVSCMISNEMFKEFFLPSIRFQCETVGRSIYHLDGPGAIQHLESLLNISSLTGIQWNPGVGDKSRQTDWIPLLQRIQEAGKCLHITCRRSEELVTLAPALKSDGLYIRTSCASPDQADELIQNVSHLFGEQ